VAAPLRYRLGERLGFAAGERGESALAGGWSRAEARGSWSDGPTAKLLLVVEDPAPRMDLLLEADPYLGAPARDLRVAVLVRSERIGTLVYIAGDAGASPMRHVMISERHLDHRGELGLTFAIEHPRSPHALGLSEDRRRLGLYLRRLVLAAARSGS
jgi:hypothetical protein